MKIDKKSKIFLFASVCILILFALSLNITNDEQTVIDDKSNDRSINTPKTSGFWELEAVILIDDDATGVDAKNWSWAVAQEWCSGVGNSTHPFLIENVSISVDSADAGLTITNSNATTHFKLNNITITNLGGNGLFLNSSTNATIISSEFTDNLKAGIHLNNVNDTSITLTTCLNNTEDGIYAINSTKVNLIVDSINNTRYGLMLEDCDNFTVVLSEFKGNEEVGLAIVEVGGDSLYNEIYTNTFENNTINGVDNCSIANQWDNGEDLGNEWDDYEGVDADDDLVGDTAYDISGSAEAVDNYPYCSDGVDVVAVSSKGGDRDLWEEPDSISISIQLALFVGIFFGILFTIVAIQVFMFGKKLR